MMDPIPVKTLNSRIRRGRILSHLLLALHVGCIVSFLWLAMEQDYEDRVFNWIVDKTSKPGMSEQERALALLHQTYKLVQPGFRFFSGRPRSAVKGWLMRSSEMMLLEGYGACGAYTGVLGRVLDEAGFEVRIVQMKVGNTWGGHILLEVRIGNEWVAIDPTYDLVFHRSDGRLASVEELHRHWDNYSDQVPSGYDRTYRYEDYRYTNWGKIPVLGKSVRMVLVAIMGEEYVRTISVRAYLLDVYKSYMWILAVLYVTLLVIPNLVCVVMRRRQIFRASGG